MAWILVLFLAASTLLRHTFEHGTSGWIAFGKGGAVRAADGELMLDYSVGEGLAGAALPLAGTDVSKMDAVRFWMKTDVPTGLAILLNEKKPGGDYTAICWSTGNTWQRVELTPADFHLNTGPKDAVDPDGKLDLDAVQNTGVLDISSIFGVKDPGLPIQFESHVGKHSFSVKDFELVSGSGVAAREKTVIDGFTTPQLQWLTLGGAELKPEGAGMRAVYQQMEEKSVVMLRQMAGADLRGRESLAFDIASEKPAQLVLSFEEVAAPGKQQGPRHNLELEIPGGGKVEHREVLLSAFDSEDGVMDLGKLKTFSILDATGNFTQVTAKNSLWIGNIRAVGDAPPQ